MNEFDDPQLASMLGRMSGEFPDVNLAHQAVHGRVRQARRRRALVSSTAAVFVLLGGAAVVAQGVGPRGQVSPADHGDASTSEASEATETSTVESSEAEDSTSSTSLEEATSTTEPGTVIVTVPSGNHGGGQGSGSSSSSSSSTPRTTVTVATDTDTSVDSAGGSIVYHWDGTTLTLVDVVPADSTWTPTVIEETATRIRVEFATSAGDRWRIEVRTDGGGKQPVEVTQHG